MCLLRILLPVLDHMPEYSSWPITAVEFSPMCFLCFLHWYYFDLMFIVLCSLHICQCFHSLYSFPPFFLTTLYLLYKEYIYSYSISNVFQPRSTQWSIYYKKMMTLLIRSSWEVWWKALRWMMFTDQWVKYWRDWTNGHILKDSGKNMNMPNWSKVGQQ